MKFKHKEGQILNKKDTYKYQRRSYIIKVIPIFVFMILKFTICNSQNAIESTTSDLNANMDTLKKYSYLIIQTQNSHKNDNFSLNGRRYLGNATGFFVRVKNKLFFISNYHVMTGVDVYSKERYQIQFDSLKIRYFDEKNNIQYYVIDLDPIKKKSRIISFLEYPDVYVYEINDFPLTAKIFSIEKFIYTKIKRQSEYKIAFSYQFTHSDEFIVQKINELRSENWIQSKQSKFLGFSNYEKTSPFQLLPSSILSNYLIDTLKDFHPMLNNLNSEKGYSFNYDPHGLFNYLIDSSRGFDMYKMFNVSNSEKGYSFDYDLHGLSNHSTDSSRGFDMYKMFNVSNSEKGYSFNYDLHGLSNHSTDSSRGFNYPIFQKEILSIKNTTPFDFLNTLNTNILDRIDFSAFLSSFYSGRVIDLTNISPTKVDSLYLLVKPSTYHGSSGSPVFYLCHIKENNKIIEWIEFAGIQSGINEDYNFSFIVRAEQLIIKLNQEMKNNPF